MVDREKIDLPVSERPLNYRSFSYFKKLTSDQLFDSVTAGFSFTFGRRIPDSYIGPSIKIMDSDGEINEAKSFLAAAKQAWERYGRSEAYSQYVKEMLEKKWSELGGEELTGIALKLASEDE